jgi:hypothetical protein
VGGFIGRGVDKQREDFGGKRKNGKILLERLWQENFGGKILGAKIRWQKVVCIVLAAKQQSLLRLQLKLRYTATLQLQFRYTNTMQIKIHR